MRATRFEFRFRVAIICTLYFVGFYAPWERLGPGANPNPPRLWSWLAIGAARSHLLSTGAAYLLVTIATVSLALLGAWLRLWGTAYLGHSAMRNPAMQAASVMASGPYRYLRNPLYIGMLLTSLAISILMPVTGALFFNLAMLVFTLRLIGGEEAFLAKELGDAYIRYRKAVPSMAPSLRPRVAPSAVAPRWLPSLIAECFPVGAAGCFAVLAWSYDADLLTRCIIVCFGVSLVVRAATSGRSAPAADVS